ncbi:MAG: TolC family protein, partial [Verrucomicrobia bacterium]|nr:TolC family protein [Verrucomicrobiota bacterium]
AYSMQTDVPGQTAIENSALSDFPVSAMESHFAELIENNFDLGAAMARFESALARAEAAGADLLPTIQGSLSGSKTQQNFIGLPIPGSQGPLTARFESYAFSLNTQWELDLWGRLRASRNAASFDSAALNLDRIWLEKSLIAAYLQSWVTGHVSLKLAGLAEEIAGNRRTISDLLDDRFGLGLVPADRVRMARTDFESARTTSLQSLKNSRDALRSMERLLGRYPSGTMTLPGDLPSELQPLVPGLPSDLLENRPDISAARNRLLAASQRLRSSQADLFPRIALTASTGTASNELADLTDIDFSVWSLGGNIARPILDWGRLRSFVNLSRAVEREAMQNYLSAIQSAFGEVEQSLDNEAMLRESIGLVQDSLTRSRAQYASTMDKFNLGVADKQTMLESHFLVLLEEQRLTQFLQQLLLNRIALWQAIGGHMDSPIQSLSYSE